MIKMFINKFKEIKDERWLKRYLKFIESFKKEKSIQSKTHNHHILPKSIYPEYKNLNTNEWNKAILTYREHYIAHYLLAKALGGKMWYAFNFLSSHKTINSKMFEYSIKERNSEISLMLKGINSNKLSVYDLNGNRFQVKIDDDRLYKTIFPTRFGSVISENQKIKARETLKEIQENGLSLSQNSYLKRNKTLFNKDINSLKQIGIKSSITQKINNKNKGKNNPNFNSNNILLFNYNGVIVDRFLHIDLFKFKDKYPTRMVVWCLLNKKPMYTFNKPRKKEYNNFIGFYACYENELYCNIDIKLRKKE